MRNPSQPQLLHRIPVPRILRETGGGFLSGLLLAGTYVGTMTSPLPIAIAANLSAPGAIAVLIGTHRHVAFQHEDFFPVVMHDGLVGRKAGRKAQDARAAALLVLRVQRAGDDQLQGAGVRCIAFRQLPAGRVQVDFVKFVMGLGNSHFVHS